jgi:chorismate mutase/prephenate dehydratase
MIFARPESFAQCRRWLATQYPHAELVAVDSSAAAARKTRGLIDASASSGSQKSNAAAIANALAGEIYGLHPLFEQIEDQRNNVTRFLILSRQETEPSGDDKTSIMFRTQDQPGALVDVLNVFKRAGVNLTHIDKCPTRGNNWEYTFFVDATGHRRDERFAEVIGEARAFSKELVILGSYPRSKQVL